MHIISSYKIGNMQISKIRKKKILVEKQSNLL